MTLNTHESSPEDDAAVSVVIPVKNAGEEFRLLLSMLRDQKGLKDLEIVTSRPVEENYFTLRKNGQLFDIACLISKSLFMKYGFRGDYAEDLDLGVRLIKDGFKLALLSPRGRQGGSFLASSFVRVPR